MPFDPAFPDPTTEFRSVSKPNVAFFSTSDRWACVARLGGLGDNLITSAVFPALKARYDRLEVITAKPWGIVFEHNPWIDKLTYKANEDVCALDAAHAGASDAWQQWFLKRSKEYALFAHTSHTCEMQLALFPFQTLFWAPAIERRHYCNTSYLEAVALRAQLDLKDPTVISSLKPGFYPTAEEAARASHFFSPAGPFRLRTSYESTSLDPPTREGPIVGWVCAGSRVDKRHPYAGLAVAQLVSRAQTRVPNLTVALIGGPDKDPAVAQEIEGLVRRANGSLSGIRTLLTPRPLPPGTDITAETPDHPWPIRRSLSQLQQCDVVVSPDTGPAWAVASLPVPKVVYLSHASPENITKHWVNTTTLTADQSRVPCYPCHRLHSDGSTCVANADNTGPACTSDITVETLVSAVLSALERGPSSPVSAPLSHAASLL